MARKQGEGEGWRRRGEGEAWERQACELSTWAAECRAEAAEADGWAGGAQRGVGFSAVFSLGNAVGLRSPERLDRAAAAGGAARFQGGGDRGRPRRTARAGCRWQAGFCVSMSYHVTVTSRGFSERMFRLCLDS